jgi:hypothetical protein
MPSLHGRRPGLARATATLMLRTVDDLRRIVRTFAFVQPKTKSSGQGITHATLRNLLENPGAVPDSVIRQINDRARQYRFFHWHLEFPGIFTVPDDGTADPNTGWTGGFSCVVGNPPWERVKLALRAATADVIEHCVYGVDVNDLAIEITKVALWLEAFGPDRPFPFLDAHFRVGNTLLGTTPALLRDNIPDTAFVALGDDDKEWTKKL